MTLDELIANLIHRTDDAQREIVGELVDTGRVFSSDDIAQRVERGLPPGYPAPEREILRRFARVQLHGSYPAGWCCYCAYAGGEEICARPPADGHDIGDRYQCECGCKRWFELRKSFSMQFSRRMSRPGRSTLLPGQPPSPPVGSPTFWAALDRRPVSKPAT